MPDMHPPKDDLIRAIRPGFELRAGEDGKPPTMFGHFSKWDTWYEVDSLWEGQFIERLAPGSARKTIRENRSDIKALFQHGMDPQVGDKPLGPVAELREDDDGPYYEVPLLDAKYVRDDILPGLEAGLYGSSFRFKVIREEWVDEPKASDYNPKALPERTIKEFRLFEFGPVTFPANPAATAGVRSLTDEFILARSRNPERFRDLVTAIGAPAPLADAGQQPTSEGRRDGPPPDDPPAADPVDPKTRPSAGSSAVRRFRTREEFIEWIAKT